MHRHSRNDEMGSFLPREFAKARWKLFVNAAESSVGEDCDDISAAKLWSDRLYDRVRIREEARRTTMLFNFGGELREFETLVLWNRFGPEHISDDDFVGLRQTARKIALQNAPAECVRAGLEN